MYEYYEYMEKATRLSNEIEIYCRKRKTDNPKSLDELAAENEWGASYLLSKILYRSRMQQYYMIDYSALKTIHDQYQTETGKQCNYDQLIKKHWLRLVGNKIKIAGTIRFVLGDVEKVTDLKNELNFLLGVRKEKSDKKIPEPEFNQSVSDYQVENKIILDLKKASEIHWLTIENNEVTIQNVYAYEPIMQNLDDFLFLKYLKEKKSDETSLYIEKNILEEIVEQHILSFPKTPSIEIFIDKNSLLPKNDTYLLNFRQGKIPFSGMVQNKAGALLWDQLLNEASFTDNTERLQWWYEHLVYPIGWCFISDFFPFHLQKSFLDAATQILLKEPDLLPAKEEYGKLKLDHGHRLYDLVYSTSNNRNDWTFAPDKDLFSLYEELSELDHDSQGQLLFMQEARDELHYYIQQIVLNDPGYKYERVIALLEAGIQKPYLLWKVAFNLYDWKPNILPYLLLNGTTCSLAFNLFWNIEFPEMVIEKEVAKNKIIENSFRLLCDFISREPAMTTTEKAKVIFQCILTAVAEQFKIIGASNPERIQKQKQNNLGLANSLKLIFEATPLPGRHFSGSGEIRTLFYPSLLSDLFSSVKNYQQQDYRKNDVIGLPFIHLDLLSWLLKLFKSDNPPSTHNATLHFQVTEFLLEIYLEKMNCISVKAWDYEKNQMADRIPSWYNQELNQELMDWKFIFLDLEKEKLLDDLLTPQRLTLNKAKDKYDNYNRFVGQKIRTHLSILLTGFNDLYDEQHSLSAKGLPAKTILDKLETKITYYITQYCVDEPERKRIDIFDSLFERTFWSSLSEELLPVIGNTLNRFKDDNKKNIIRELVQTDQLVRSFKLLEYLVSENDKEKLFNLISEHDIQQFFSSTYSKNDATYVLQALTEEKRFEEKAKQALGIWESKPARGYNNEKDEHNIMCFRMKLLLAYHEGDEQKISDIQDPILNSSFEKFSSYEEKDFYRALIYLQKKEAEKAYIIFNEQLTRPGDFRPSLALNRFAAKLQWADQTAELSEKARLYQEAIEEWNNFQNGLSHDIDLEYIKDKIWYNKLHGYAGLKNEKDFELIFTELEKPLQLRPDFLELRITNLVDRKLMPQAESLLSEAENYHRLSDGHVPESVLSLRKLTDTIETIQFLKDQYHRIFSKSPEELIRILPENINKHSTLSEFLLSEIVGAANDLLTYINSLSEIKKEDKYSDLMVLSLANRMRNYGWHVGNARGGYSGSGKWNPGEIDYAFFGTTEKLAVCEAMQLKGTNITEVQKHSFKIFNYDHTRKLFFIIVYYIGDSDKFLENWKSYCDDLLNIIEFPIGFDLAPSGVTDISASFGNDSIKTAKSVHGDNTILYHVFININYRKDQILSSLKPS